jgi:hypothetical protein
MKDQRAKLQMVMSISQAKKIMEEISLIAIGLPWTAENPSEEKIDKKRLYEKGRLINEKCFDAVAQLSNSLEAVIRALDDDKD